MDEVSPFVNPFTPALPGGMPCSMDTDRRSSDRPKTLPERADEVERRLGLALKTYRERAEDILEEHFDAMEKSQVDHDHEVSMLKAENAKLREMIGKMEDPSFVQSVLFQSMTPVVDANAKKKDAKNKMKSGGDADDGNSVNPAAKRKQGKNKDAPEQPGGSWQQFIAWVPNGAALLNPEPWKPLPAEQLMNFPMQGGKATGLKSQRSIAAGIGDKQVSGGQFWGVMPSGGSDDHKNRDDESNSDNSSRSGLKAKRELLEVWQPTEREQRDKDKNHRGSCAGAGAAVQSSDNNEDDFYLRHSGKSEAEGDFEQLAVPPRYIINPDAGIRIAWDMSSLSMVVYDMIMIPMALFSMPEEHPFLVMMDWTTRVFWTLDMGWSCCTGIVCADGTVEYNWRIILKTYLKSWFGLDVFIVGSDWFGVILSSGGMGMAKLARVSRVARVVRLLRLVRMQEVIASITERVQNDKLLLLLQIFKLLVFLIATCHVTACGWWGVGSATSGRSWVKEYRYVDKDVGEQYLVSLHWALSQFSGGIEELAPTGGVERFYTILIWVLSFISGLVMLSFLTSCLTQQYIINGSGARQMASLKKYLSQNKIPKNLIKRLCRSAKHAISGDLQPESVDLLHVVSEPLRIEMHFEMFSRIVAAHPFFSDFLREGNHVMRRVCHSCMTMLLLDSGDVLFQKGDEPAEGKMYFVVSGSFEYEHRSLVTHTVGPDQWLSEAALWTTWMHQGTLTAVSDAKMAVIESDAFQEVCNHYMKKAKGAGFNPKHYAATFVDHLNQLDELSDLHFVESG